MSSEIAGWQLGKLHDRFAKEGEPFLSEALNGVSIYTDIFQYHLASARDAMKGILHEGEAHEHNIGFVLGASERQSQFERGKLISAAHLLGCAHSARAIYDLFAQLVNGTILDNEVAVPQVDIHKISKVLRASPLKSELFALRDSFWFKYLDAFVNLSKHRMLVRLGLHVDFESVDGDHVYVSHFEFNDQHFEQRQIREVLEGFLEVKNRVINCGNLLNATLEK